MPYHVDLLPKFQIEALFQTRLTIQHIHQVNKIKTLHPRVYGDAISYLLRCRPNDSLLTKRQSTPKLDQMVAGIEWQLLRLPNGEVCSELIVLRTTTSLYLAFLSLLPATYGLFAPALLPKSVTVFNQLLVETIHNLINYSKCFSVSKLATTLYNPNLVQAFKESGFKESVRGPDIVGLPLPAEFILSLR